MSIVRELQSDAIDSQVSVSELLRKSYLVARKLNLSEFSAWIEKELNGYTNESGPVPDYRWINGELRAHNPYHGLIPVRIPGAYGDLLNRMPNFQPLPEIESLVQIGKQNPESLMSMTLSETITDLIYSQIQFNMRLPLIFVTSASQLEVIVHAVRHGILDWALQLESDGIVGENMSFSDKEKQTAQTHAHSIGTFISVGTMNQSQLQQGTTSSSQEYTYSQSNYEKVKSVLEGLSEWLPDSPLNNEQKAEITADIQTVTTQIDSPKPKTSIVRAGLESVKNVLEQVSAALIAANASAQATEVAHWVSKVMHLLAGSQ